MAVNKNFVVKNGLEVKDNLLVADGSTSKVGIGTSVSSYELHVIGGMGGGEGGGGGGSGYNDGSITIVDTQSGGSTGNAKVILRVVT